MTKIHKTFRIASYFVLRENIYDTLLDKKKGKRCNRSNNRGGKLLVIGVTSDRATLPNDVTIVSLPTLAFYHTNKY